MELLLFTPRTGGGGDDFCDADFYFHHRALALVAPDGGTGRDRPPRAGAGSLAIYALFPSPLFRGHGSDQSSDIPVPVAPAPGRVAVARLFDLGTLGAVGALG